MSTTTPEVESNSRSDKYVTDWKAIAIPYAIAILAQVPMLTLYFRNLFLEKPHYQSAPFAFLATLAIAYFRWPKEAKMPFHRSVLSDLLLVLGLIFGVTGVLFVWPTAGAGSLMFLLSSLLARTVDKETLKSLWPASLPMFVYLTLPGGYDIQLITTLQRWSAVCTSRVLDIYSLPHFMDGTVIKVPGKAPYGIEAACSGVQSFFTLLFVAVLFAVVFRRPLFRSIVLIVSAVFWALFMNTVRIFLIPVLDQVGIDVAHGFSHAMLGWGTLAVGVVLLMSTDQFLIFLFGPVEKEVGEAGPFGKLVTKAWNGLISGKAEEETHKKRSRRSRKPITSAGKMVIWGVCGILTLGGLWSSYDVALSWFTAPDHQRWFDADYTLAFDENALPEQIGQWTAVEDAYDISTREAGSDYGKRSDSWQFRAPRYPVVISFDQPFPGWHELTSCYRNANWELVSRERKDPAEDGGLIKPDTGEDNWPYVVSEFKKPTGERAYLAFALFNSLGQPVDPPSSWNRLSVFILGAKLRLSNRIRASLFDNSTYQVQAFVTTYSNGFDESTAKEIEAHFLEARELIREKFIAKTTGQSADDAPATPQPVAAN